MSKLIGKNESKRDTIITPWTFIHFLSGLYITYLLKFMNKTDFASFITYNFFHFIYEVKDYLFTYYYKNSRKTSKDKANYNYNSFPNSVGDIIFGLLGSILILYLIQQNNKILDKNILIIFTTISTSIILLFIFSFTKYNIG